jgi:hypothetical protein
MKNTLNILKVSSVLMALTLCIGISYPLFVNADASSSFGGDSSIDINQDATSTSGSSSSTDLKQDMNGSFGGNSSTDLKQDNSAPIITYTLTYIAGANGTLTGSTSQMVNNGADGAAVTAVPAAGFHFVNWIEDASTTPTRTDTDVTSDLTFTANFAADQVTPCTIATTTVVSDTSTMVGDDHAVAVTVINPVWWTASIPGATWIWGVDPVADPLSNTSFTFTRTFDLTSTATPVVLEISADNTFSASINGKLIGSDSSEFNYTTVHAYTVDPSVFNVGSNTLTVTVTNLAMSGGTTETNPAGLLYKLSIGECNGENPVNHPPTITLNGDATTTISVGDTFTDPGATATDIIPGDLNSSIIVTGGPVATSTVGTTTLTYTVTDSGGSASTTRTVIVNATTTGQALGTLTIGQNDDISTTTDSTDSSVIIDFTLPTVTTTATTSLDAIATTSISCIPSSGSSFTVGTTTQVVCTASDSAGNNATSTFNVTVSTTTPNNPAPVIPSGGGGSSSSSGGSFYGGSSGGIANILPTNLGSIANSCPLLTSYMRIDLNNDPAQVTKLKLFLNAFEGSNLSVNGIFDQATDAAVRAFQTKYLSSVMGPWGASQGSGYVYITTLKEINEIACNQPFQINAAEQAIIDAYKNAQNGQIGANNVGPITPAILNASTTPLTPTPEVGVNTNTGAANTASVVNAPVLQRMWDWIKGLF